MAFQSVLFERIEDAATGKTLDSTPDFFLDLNLNQVVDAITADKQEYNLKSFFYFSLHDPNAIRYRQDIMRELEDNLLFNNVKSFAQQMRAMREQLAEADKLEYKWQKESLFLDAVSIYCDAVSGLLRELFAAGLKSRGLLAFREYLTRYVESNDFTLLVSKTKKLKADLAAVRYCVFIKGHSVTVRKPESEIDYRVQVDETFGKFKQAAVHDYSVQFDTTTRMNHVEAKILELVSQFYPGVFLNLDQYCAKYSNFLDHVVAVFDREIQFYVAYLEYIARFKRAGLKFCYPEVSNRDKEVFDYEGFDLALAQKLIEENKSVVCNDLCLRGKERIFVVTGPNQGGKTTFARTFGQLHFLASLGCAVPGREAKLFLFDKLLAHFEKEENVKDLRGKLEDDLIRIHGILEQASSHTLIIINEIFTSTTARDALFLSKKILKRIIDLDLLCVCVTFIDELASLSEKTVSMVSTVAPENPTLRTYKVVRKPADGLAYAISIAEKYRVTSACLKERLPHENFSDV